MKEQNEKFDNYLKRVEDKRQKVSNYKITLTILIIKL